MMAPFCSLDLHYAVSAAQPSTGLRSPKDDWHVAVQLINTSAAPHVRLAAVQLLTLLCQQHDVACTAADIQQQQQQHGDIDTAFQVLCSVASADPVACIRLQALAGLSGMHQASTAVKLQALSKRAVLSLPAPASTASASSSSRPQIEISTSVMEAATGAFIHSTEDDTARVRLAAVDAMRCLGERDQLFADSAAEVLTDVVFDELIQVRLASLACLLSWAQRAAEQHDRKQQQQQQQGTDSRTTSHMPQEEQEQQQQQQQNCEPEQQQQQQVDPADVAMVDAPSDLAADAAAGSDSDVDDDLEEGQLTGPNNEHRAPQQPQQQQQPPQEHQQPPPGLHNPADSQPAIAARGSQRGGRSTGARSRQLRKLGLPPWAPDGLPAAASALQDKDSRVRLLALKLLRLLLPANTHGLMCMLLGLCACCERYQQQADMQAVMQLVQLTGQTRAEVVGRSLRQLVQQLSQASVAPATPGLVACVGDHQRSLQHAVCTAHPSQQLGEAASAVAHGPDQGPGGFRFQIAMQLLHSAALARPQMLPSLRMYLEKAELLQHMAVQQLLLVNPQVE